LYRSNPEIRKRRVKAEFDIARSIAPCLDGIEKIPNVRSRQMTANVSACDHPATDAG
jgi:hypothetical protein